MEPTPENHLKTQMVYIRTHPTFALCNVTYLLSKPLANRFGKDKHSKRFVNAAGGSSRQDRLSHNRDRSSSGVWVLRDDLTEDSKE